MGAPKSTHAHPLAWGKNKIHVTNCPSLQTWGTLGGGRGRGQIQRFLENESLKEN
jgi:hypothetical protein